MYKCAYVTFVSCFYYFHYSKFERILHSRTNREMQINSSNILYCKTNITEVEYCYYRNLIKHHLFLDSHHNYIFEPEHFMFCEQCISAL